MSEEIYPVALGAAARMRVSSLCHTFENWDMQPGSEASFEAVYGIASGESDRKLALIYGGVGCGKTHLLEASVIEFNSRGIVCRYYLFHEIIDLLRGCIHRNEPYDDIIKRWCYTAAPIVIDDIGMGSAKEKLTEFEAGILEEITDARYRRRLITIMATNLDKDDLPSRVVSRFRDRAISCLVLNEAGDYRKNGDRETI